MFAPRESTQGGRESRRQHGRAGLRTQLWSSQSTLFASPSSHCNVLSRHSCQAVAAGGALPYVTPVSLPKPTSQQVVQEKSVCLLCKDSLKTKCEAPSSTAPAWSLWQLTPWMAAVLCPSIPSASSAMWLHQLTEPSQSLASEPTPCSCQQRTE